MQRAQRIKAIHQQNDPQMKAIFTCTVPKAPDDATQVNLRHRSLIDLGINS